MDTKKKNKPSFLSQAERQSPVAIILILFRFFGIIIRQLFPLLLIFLFNPAQDHQSWITVALTSVGGVSVLLSIFSYFKFFYYIKGDEIIIEKGIFQKKKLNVPFERIQTINFNQNLIHRFFNVVALEIDTAGSKGKEFSINALSKTKAEKIRTYILAQRDTLTESDTEQLAQTLLQDKLLLRLDIGDLLKIGLGRNHIRSIGVIAGTLFGWLQFAEDILGKKKVQMYEREYYEVIAQSVLFIGIGLLLIAILITLLSTLIRFFDLHFFQTHQGYKIQSGLFNRKENAAKTSKIQFIRWTTNPLQALFGLYKLQLLQAASTSISQRQSIVIPGCYMPQIDTVRASYFPNEHSIPYTKHRIHPRIILRYILLYGFVPALLFVGVTQNWSVTVLLYAAIWICVIGLLSFLYYKKWQFSVSIEGILIQKGMFSTSITLLRWFKVQSVQIRQSIFQKRRHLADIVLYTASGAIRIPYIPEAKALQLKNYILFKTETSKKDWM